VKIGHGPATVIGRRRASGSQRLKVRNVPVLGEARALREKERRATSLVHFARLFCCADLEKYLGLRGVQKSFAIAVLAASTFICAGLAAAQSEPSNSVTAVPGKTVTDETGRRVVVPPEVRRIVTLSPDLTETVYALGLGDRLVGDTDVCDTPPAAKLKPHVGNAISPNLEEVVALHPDLVMATTSINRSETVDSLKRLGITVYATDPHTVEGMLKSIERIAGLAGAEQRGRELVASLRERLDALHARLADRPLVHVLFVVWEDPLITIGQNTFIADALRWAGAESVILSNQNWPRVGLEVVVKLQPDYIILTSDHEQGEGKDSEDFKNRAGWREVRAVQQGHIVVVGSGIDRPSPGLVDAIEGLAHALHPEAFKERSGSRKPTMQDGSMTLHACGQQLQGTLCAL
jgi:iron complex transport system substrate-binding protein